MKLYLVRHGQTDWNLGHIMQGQTDIPLNATGIKQASALKEKLKDYDFDICYCSPLKRALETARIVLDGRDLKTIFDDDLKERYYGELEGMELKNWGIDRYSRRLNLNNNGIEPIKTLLARSKKFLKRVKSENSTDAKVLVVAHGSLLKTLHFNIVGYDDDTDFHSFHLENGEVVEYEI